MTMKYLLSILTITTTLLFASGCHASKPEWHMVNVNQHGQGDAHLLIDNGVVTLIDAGEFSQGADSLAPYILSMGINTVNHLFVSHPHRDHYGGIDALLNAGIDITNIYYNMPDDMPDDWDFKRVEFNATLGRAQNNGTNLANVKQGFELKTSQTKLVIVHAQKERKVDGRNIDTNDYSLIIQWDAGEFRTLFTGDLNEIVGTKLSELDYMKADILKMPHHGVTGIAPNSFFNKVDPSFVMFPSTHALWGHPRGAQAKSWTMNSGVKYCNNGLNGHVVLRFGSTVSVSSQTPTGGCPNGDLGITPGEKIEMKKDLGFLPAIYYLLSVGPFDTPPDYSIQVPGAEVE